MENRNIYKLDDVLLYLSLILLAPALFFAWPWLRGLPDASDLSVYFRMAPEVLGEQTIVVLSYLTGAVVSQIAGRYLRYQENLSLKILDEIGYSRKVRISEISSRLGMSEAKVTRLVRKLSGVASLEIGLEGDRIIRTRKTPAYRPPAPDTASTVTPADSTAPASSAAPASSEPESGDTPQDLSSRFEQINKNGSTGDLKSIFEEMKKSGETPDLKEIYRQTMAPSQESSEHEGKPLGCMGMGILILLFMTPLWPIPLVIFIRKAIKQRGMSQEKKG